MIALNAALAQKEQEPVAHSVGRTLHWHEGRGINDAQLFTTPPRREWQRLTDEEMHGLYRRAGMEAYYPRDGVVQYEYERRLDAYARAIEAALKEKNT